MHKGGVERLLIINHYGEEKVSAAVLRLWMINAGVVQLKSVKKLEEEILEIDKKLEELKNERRIKVLLVQAVKLELVSISFNFVSNNIASWQKPLGFDFERGKSKEWGKSKERGKSKEWEKSKKRRFSE